MEALAGHLLGQEGACAVGALRRVEEVHLTIVTITATGREGLLLKLGSTWLLLRLVLLRLGGKTVLLHRLHRHIRFKRCGTNLIPMLLHRGCGSIGGLLITGLLLLLCDLEELLLDKLNLASVRGNVRLAQFSLFGSA